MEEEALVPHQREEKELVPVREEHKLELKEPWLHKPHLLRLLVPPVESLLGLLLVSFACSVSSIRKSDHAS